MRKYHPTGAQPRIPVWGPPDTPGRMARAYDLPLDPGMSEEFDFRPHEPVVEVGPFRVESAPVVHPVDAFALRVTADGRSVAYSGDTGPCESLERARRGCRPVPVRGVVPRRRGQPARPAHDRLRVRHGRRRAPGWAVWCSPTSRRGTTPQDALAEARTTWDGPLELAVAGAVYSL